VQPKKKPVSDAAPSWAEVLSPISSRPPVEIVVPETNDAEARNQGNRGRGKGRRGGKNNPNYRRKPRKTADQPTPEPEATSEEPEEGWQQVESSKARRVAKKSEPSFQKRPGGSKKKQKMLVDWLDDAMEKKVEVTLLYLFNQANQERTRIKVLLHPLRWDLKPERFWASYQGSEYYYETKNILRLNYVGNDSLNQRNALPNAAASTVQG